MKLKKLFNLIASAALLAAILATLCACGDYSAETLVTNTTDVSDKFSKIVIKTDTSNVYFQPATDGKVSVVCRESEHIYHSVTVESDTLVIGEVDTRSDIEKLKPQLNLFTRMVIIYLPAGEYASLNVEIDTGNIVVPKGYNFENVDIETDTGDVDFNSNGATIEINTDTGSIKVSEANAENIKLDTDTGDISVEDTLADRISADTDSGDISILYSDFTDTVNASSDKGKIRLTYVCCATANTTNNAGKIVLLNLVAKKEINSHNDMGDIELLHSDAPSITLGTNVGSVRATILSPKQFTVKTNLGKVTVPESSGEQTCKITTDVGDITVTIESILTVE